MSTGAFSTRPRELDQLVRALADNGVDYEGPVEHEGGDRSLYFEDPEGSVVEAWDFFEHSDGAPRRRRWPPLTPEEVEVRTKHSSCG